MRKWTREQAAAIAADGGNLLVTAAAGSGKTSVLTERVIRRVTQGEARVDLDRLLVVTFTKAAAGEMRERIGARLAECIRERPYDPWLLRQQTLLYQANICTIHSFCASLLRENFQKAGVACDFRVADEGEYRVLMADTLDELLEEYYADPGREGFAALTELFSADRSDRRLRAAVERFHSFLMSHAFYDEWLARAEALFAPGTLAGSLWEREALRRAGEDVAYAEALTRAALTLMEDEPAMREKYEPAFREDLQKFERLRALIEAGEYAPAAEFARSFTFPSLGQLRGYGDERRKSVVTACRKKCKDLVASLAAGVLSFDEARFQADQAEQAPVVRALIGLVREFLDRLAEKKRDLGVLGFDDLEQLSVRILAEPDVEGGYRRTDVARERGEAFAEILIDEYQDTNEAQNLILWALSRDDRNRFMVGDVKQSIYGFRNAAPQLFLKKKAQYAPWMEGKAAPAARVSMNANFRSRAGVTDFINFLFSSTMSRGLGGVDYDGEERLVAAAQYPVRPGADVEVHLLETRGDAEQEDDKESADAAEAEARFVARRIRAMCEAGFPVSDGSGGLRPARYGDFAVLYRSLKSRKNLLARVFSEEAVPIRMEASGGFFHTPEILLAVSLLKILDNPQQDIPLTAVMCSPVFGFTPDDLAAIRVSRRESTLYGAVVGAAEEDGNEAAARLLEELAWMRRTAAQVPTHLLLLRIYARTGLPELYRAQRGGEMKAANLALLVSYARQAAQAGMADVAAFLAYIARMEENGDDLPVAPLTGDAAGAVNIVTIHKSKGLEYPIVFVSGCATRFNLRDCHADALLHRELCFGGKIRRGNVFYTTLQREVISRRMRTESVSEELRVLYVAMTRAREKLILTAAAPGMEQYLRKAAAFGESASLAECAARDADSMLWWIASAVLRHPCAGALRASLGLPGLAPAEASLPAEFSLHRGSETVRQDAAAADAAAGEKASLPAQSPQREAERACMPGGAEEPSASPDGEAATQTETLPPEVLERFNWRYPYAEESAVPVKLSVSALTRHGEETPAPEVRPRFLTQRTRLNGAEAGTAMHLFLSSCDLTRAASGGLRAEAERLVAEKYMTQRQCEAVDFPAVEAFFASPLGARVAAAAARGECEREYGFNQSVPSELAGAYPPGHCVLVSGVADLVFREAGELVLVDFKTDHVQAGEELVQRYGTQVRLYARALSGVFGAPVRERWLYSFALGCPVAVPEEEAVP